MKNLGKKCAAIALSLLATGMLHAQPIIPPSTGDQFLSGDIAPEMNINCDMLLHDHLKAITWQGANGVNVHISDDASGSFDFDIPGARWSDIAFFDYRRLAVIYVLNNEVHLDVYTLSGAGTGTITASLGIPILVSTNSTPELRPHIDAISEPATFGFNHYVISYLEENSGIYTLYARHGIVGSSTLTTPVSVVSQSIPFVADIAGYDDAVYGNYYGVMAIQNMDNHSLDFAELLLNTNVITAYNVLYPNIPNPIFVEPRIEAMFSYDNLNHWNIVSTIFDGSMDPWVFNPSGGFNTMASYPGWHNWSPAVAAGTGYLDYVSFANINYPIGWYTTAQDCFVTQAVDVYSGTINPWYPDFYRANTGSTPMFPLYGNVGLALSSSSDWGADLLTAWYDINGAVFYKLTPDITAYKPAPTGISQTGHADAYKIYPNPVADYLYIDGMTATGTYAISDITGKVVGSGTIADPSKAAVATNELSKGIYFLKLSDKNGAYRTFKFAKK